MATKTSKPKTETPVEQATAPVSAPADTTPETEQIVQLPTSETLTEAERRELLEQLSPEHLQMVAGMLEVLERKQFFDNLEESSKRHEARRQHQLAEAALIAAGESLDDVERMSLHLIGKLALDFSLTRSQVYSDDTSQLYWLFKSINDAIREALPHIDTDVLECIKEAEREKERKAKAAQEDEVDGDE